MIDNIKREIKKQIKDHMDEMNSTAVASLEYIEKLIEGYETDRKKGSAGMSNKDWKLLNRIMQKANIQQLEYIKKFADTYTKEKTRRNK